ncbi:MAG: hypothetical protein KC549_03195 [Myxococcales bacterium]|nr:hypothetical protein [Myxococcales bacterium]MCB9546699.1 hypothetical protein [Myxococcales bacterium]
MHRTLGLIALVAAGPALAEPLLYEQGGFSTNGIVAGLKVGADFSSPFNELGTSPAVELEIGWLLPALDRSLELFLAGQWAGPTGEGDLPADPRLPGDGVASYTVDQQQLRLSLGLLYRLPLDSTIRPYATLGGRAWLLKTTMDGEADGQDFGTYTEKSTEYGVFGALGGEWHTDYGALLLEVEGGWAAYDRTLFEDTAVGTLAVQLGWRFFL